MDFGQINWGLFGAVASGVLLIVWLAAGLRGKASLVGWIVGLAHVIAAGLNSAAPLRGLLDPSYSFYGFGLITADDAIQITTMAGAVFLTAVVGAFSALRRSREAMLITAVTSGVFLVVLGWDWLVDMLDGIHTNIQIGDDLVIPGVVAKGVVAVFMVLPFLVGTFWGLARAARAPSAVTEEA